MLFFKSKEYKNIIDEKSDFSGILKSKSSVLIKGNFYGKIITAKNLSISSTSSTNADIKAENLFLNGELSGTVEVENTFELNESANFKGKIIASKIIFNKEAKIRLTDEILVADYEEK